jgi:serine/threonine-protein kinase
VQPERIGPYSVREQIGRGGMGAVYKAWDERLRRWVAIKCIEPGTELSAERRERLQREARAVAGLSHPAVAQVFDFITDEERDYIVMEYVDGRSLASHLLGGPLQVARALAIAGQIAEGLAAAHDRGVIHRDLKADNIIITANGQAKILDFGLAKRFDPDANEDSLTEEGVVMGTTRAMSPEQAEGRDLDQRSDLFSLGSLLYEMVTGRHPFQASSPLETMQRVVRHQPTSIRRLHPTIPKEVELLVEQLLEKDCSKRPADADQVSRALEALQSRLERLGADSDALDSLTTKAKRRRWWRRRWLLVVAILVVVAVVFAILLW